MTGKSTAPTVKAAAEWMAGEFHKNDWLDQQTAAGTLLDLFGEVTVYENDNGNLAISKDVLREFRKLTEHSAIWIRSERAWRRRDDTDGDGRQEE